MNNINTNQINEMNDNQCIKEKKVSLRDPPINFHYTQCKFEFDENLIPLIIGKDGAHLKRITELSNTEYIWWNNDKKIIEIWGREWRLPVAIGLLKSHIKFIENKVNQKDIIETD